MSVALSKPTTTGRCDGSEKIMTVLGAVVFGGMLALGVLWLLLTAPANEAQEAWDQFQRPERLDVTGAASTTLTHSQQ
jgi:hypothetical protein